MRDPIVRSGRLHCCLRALPPPSPPRAKNLPTFPLFSPEQILIKSARAPRKATLWHSAQKMEAQTWIFGHYAPFLGYQLSRWGATQVLRHRANSNPTKQTFYKLPSGISGFTRGVVINRVMDHESWSLWVFPENLKGCYFQVCRIKALENWSHHYVKYPDLHFGRLSDLVVEIIFFGYVVQMKSKRKS